MFSLSISFRTCLFLLKSAELNKHLPRRHWVIVPSRAKHLPEDTDFLRIIERSFEITYRNLQGVTKC